MRRWFLAIGAVVVTGVALLAALSGGRPTPEPARALDEVRGSGRDERADGASGTTLAARTRRLGVRRVDAGRSDRVPPAVTGPSKAYSVRLDELQTFCWGDPNQPSRPYVDEPIDMFAIRIPTRTGAATPFDFCIEEVRFGQAPVVWGKDGLVDGRTSALGLGGKWFPFSDEVTEWQRPRGGRSFQGSVGAGAPLCVKGTAPQVFEGHYADYWGAAVGFDLHMAEGAGGLRRRYRPRFTSITVVLRGEIIPGLLTLAVDQNPWREDNESWCKFVQ